MRPYTLVISPELLPQIAGEVLRADAVALDLETANPGGGGSVDPFTGRVRLCSLNTGKGRYVIDLYKTGTFGPVAGALNTTNAVIVGQNLKFDAKWLLWHYDVELKRIFDTFRASSILYAGIPGLHHDLWSLYKRELNEKPETEDLSASDWDAAVLTQEQYDYSADDVDKLLRLREVLKTKIVKEGLAKVAQIEFQATIPEACIELNGFFLDPDMWRRRAAMDDARARALHAVLLDALPNPNEQQALPGFSVSKENEFNIDSPPQVLKALQKMGVTQKYKDPETRVTSVVPLMDTKEVTLAMEADNWPILQQLVEYRGYAQRVKTFNVEYLTKNIHPVTRRIHTQYHPYTDTGRYACVAPWTPIRTAQGLKRIVDTRVGDFVWTHKERWREVTAFLPQGTQECFHVRFSNGQTLTCTKSHRLLLSNGQWVTVEALLNEGLHSPLFAGAEPSLVTVEEIHPAGRLEVYDLTVDEDESYETYGIFSHNCRSPNLQAVPREKAFRECFRAEDGRVIIGADYSNVEMRLAAEISGDKTLIKVFQEDRDAHYATAALLADKTEKEVTKPERQQAKPVNFGFCIAEGQRVLTRQSGLVAIEKVQLWHQVWDGREWVSHEGVICMGERDVLSFDGLTATPDHMVYTEAGFKIPFYEAASTFQYGDIAMGALNVSPLHYDAYDWRAAKGLVTAPTPPPDVRMPKTTRTVTYDLLNAGPRHRFTVEGKIVSNCYGMQAAKLVLYAKAGYGVTFTEAQARKFRKKFFEVYDGIASWHSYALESGKRRQECRSIWGRRRIIKDEKAHNEFLNSPVQSSGADALKNALRLVHEKLRPLNNGKLPLLGKGATVGMIHMVHDEILLEGKDDPELIPLFEKTLQAGMVEALAPMMKHVPAVADPASGKDWSCKG